MRIRTLGILFFLQFSLSSMLQARPLDFSPEPILGKWIFVGYFFRDQFFNPPNPNLKLTFDFLQDGTDWLRWSRNGDPGFCERQGKFEYNGEILTDEIIWVNPKNSLECSKDPDMRIGGKKQTPLKRVKDQLFLDMPLSEEVITYVWDIYKENDK